MLKTYVKKKIYTLLYYFDFKLSVSFLSLHGPALPFISHSARHGVPPGHVSSPSRGHMETNNHSYNLPDMHVLVRGRKPEYLEKSWSAWGEHANSTQTGQEANLRPSCCETTAPPTAPPDSVSVFYNFYFFFNEIKTKKVLKEFVIYLHCRNNSSFSKASPPRFCSFIS